MAPPPSALRALAAGDITANPYSAQRYGTAATGPAAYGAYPAYGAYGATAARTYSPYGAPAYGAPPYAAPAPLVQPYAVPGYGVQVYPPPAYGEPAPLLDRAVYLRDRLRGF